MALKAGTTGTGTGNCGLIQIPNPKWPVGARAISETLLAGSFVIFRDRLGIDSELRYFLEKRLCHVRGAN
jgi:hypothetical protein